MHHTSLCFDLEGLRITTPSPPPGGQQAQAAIPPTTPGKQHPKAKGHWKNKKAQGGYKQRQSGANNEVSILKAQVQQLQQQANTKQNYNQVPPPASQPKTESSAGSQDGRGGQPPPVTI